MSDDKSRESAPEAQAPVPEDTAASTAGIPDGDEKETFDAIGAAAELADILGAEEPNDPVEQHGESYTDILESEVAELSALLEKRDTEVAEAKEELSRSLERVEREYERQGEQRTRKMLLEFIDVLDDLDRALTSARAGDHNPAVVDGVELVRKSFMRKLASFGVTHDPSMGETFDPNLHDAMSVTSVTEEAQHNKVVAVIREGYKIGDAVLRPAGVVVGKQSG